MNLQDYALIKKATLTDIGDGIREQEGSTAGIPPDEMKPRILALGGSGVEYTTGKVTFAGDVNSKTIFHGLSKAPKLFILKWDEYDTTMSMKLNMALYTESVSSIWAGAQTTITFNGMYATVPGVYIPGYGAMTADDTSVMISTVARSWNAGDYTWEAYTW